MKFLIQKNETVGLGRGFGFNNQEAYSLRNTWLQQTQASFHTRYFSDVDTNAFHYKWGHFLGDFTAGSAVGGIAFKGIKAGASVFKTGEAWRVGSLTAGSYRAAKRDVALNRLAKMPVQSTATVNRPATSSMSNHLLKNKLIAEEISGGHAFTKHVIQRGEFPGLSQQQFQRHIQNILNNPTEIKLLTRGRVAYWDQKTGTVIIRNPLQGDGGTAFRPTAGYDYFLKELK